MEGTGLPFLFLVELTLKTIFNGGQLRLWDLKERLKLPVAVIEPIISFMRAERLCEVQQRGVVENEIAYALTDLGRGRAHGAMEKSLYVGPVPVPLEAYERQIERQSVNDLHIGRDDVHRAFDGIVIAQRLLDQVGPAMNSGRAIFIHGPSGSGKSSLAFQTIYAEGQRRYVETFSPYMRQFLDRMDKPRVDDIRGIPPAIAIEQANPVKTSRSTVGMIRS